MSLQRSLLVLVALGAALALWSLASRPDARTGAGAPAVEGEPAPPRAVAAPGAAQAVLVEPARARVPVPTLAAAPAASAPSSPPPAEDTPARRGPRERPARGERPGPASDAAAEPKAYLLLAVAVAVQGPPLGVSEADARRDALVDIRLLPGVGAASGRAPLGRAVDLRVGVDDFEPSLLTGVKAWVVVDHPGYARWERVLELGPPGVALDESGAERLRYRFDVTLAPFHAALLGEASATTHVALARYSGLRRPGPLDLADLAPVQGGRYRLRAPEPGDWVVIALRERQHPRYAIVTVGASESVVHPGFRLRPFQTALRVQGRAPNGFDPRGGGVELAPFAEDLEPLEDQPGQSAARPLLTWHPTAAAAPDAEGFGVDLRAGSPEPQLRDAIVWRSTRATFDGAGQAAVQGGPTGLSLLRVDRPFVPGGYFEEPALVPAGFVEVALAVARVDVTASGPEGRLAHGIVEAQAWPKPRFGQRQFPRRRGPGGGDPGVTQTATLDAQGVGVLFVPSEEDLRVTVRDVGNRVSAAQGERAFGKATQQSRIYVAAPGPAGVNAPPDEVEWFVGPEAVRSGDGRDG